MPLMLACDTSAWARARRSVPSGMRNARSAPKSQVPVTFASADGRTKLLPTMVTGLSRVLRICSGLISPRMIRAASITASMSGL